MSEMHPRYSEARKRLRDLGRLYPQLRQHTATIGIRWREAFEKDPTGAQCVHYLDDLVERLS